MHLHDNDGISDSHLSPGDGTVDWTELVAAMTECDNLAHVEIESFNPEGRSHIELMNLYKSTLSHRQCAK